RPIPYPSARPLPSFLGESSSEQAHPDNIRLRSVTNQTRPPGKRVMKGIKSASEKRDQLAAAKVDPDLPVTNLLSKTPATAAAFPTPKTDFLVAAARRGERTPLDHRRRSCRVTTFHSIAPPRANAMDDSFRPR
uniref:Uncharacterized protein n=1 Tax=Anopheles coluzzii TaxID=1518534 RepID=A0A6E8VUM9_ANOCL